jgi:MoaA/NifB/PqqE/SkfB family radical SAM enzyme
MKNFYNTFLGPHVLEITTNIGCRVACSYCPQRALSENKNKLSEATKHLTLENFKLLCSKIPKTVRIGFSGFSEPFLNKDCIKMIEYAHSEGYSLYIYTTLEGFNTSDIHIFKNNFFDEVCIHVPSDENLMNIQINEEYIEKVKLVLSFLKNHINIIKPVSCIGDNIHSRLDFIDKNLINLTKVNDTTSRAGNNLKKKSPNWRNYSKIICKHNRLTKNVVLPDGTVTLCCMDWSLKHILGNIFLQKYDEIFNGEIVKNIRNNMSNNKSDILCWSCEYAVPVY